MFDIGWSELLVVAVVAIVVIGPKDLPKLARTVGHYAGKLRRAAADFQRQFEEAIRESEAEEVRKNIESIKSTMGTVDLKAPIDKPVMLPKEEPEWVGGGAAAAALPVEAKPPAGSAKRKQNAKAPSRGKTAAKPKAVAKPKMATKPQTAAKRKTASTKRRTAKAEPGA
jgi:sec-independent protein translocase protein TatB